MRITESHALPIRAGLFDVPMRRHDRILCIEKIGSIPYMYTEMDTDDPVVERQFTWVAGTITVLRNMLYCDSVKLNGKVWHLYEWCGADA